MTIKNILILLAVIVLLGAGGFWLYQSGQEQPNNDNTQEYTDPATLQPGQQFGVFTVESVTKDENGDWQVQLRGEKVVRGRDFASNPFNQDPEGGEVCFWLHEAGDEPIAPALNEYSEDSFCLREVKPPEFEKQIPAENFHDYIYIKMRITDPIIYISTTHSNTATLLEILSIANFPDNL